MFEKIKSVFKKPVVKPIKLSFEMDWDSEGMHHVTVFRVGENGFEQIDDIHSILAPGYYEEIKTTTGLVYQVLDQDDRQTLLSLKSLNPEIQSDGTMIFEVIPPVLKYLRKKKVIETPAAQEVKISDQPLQPTARINFIPERGLKIEAGYQLGKDDPLLVESEIKLTKDGQYTRIGNTFVPVPKVNSDVQEYLQRKNETIPINKIPEFFMRDYVLLKRDINAVLVDQASNISIFTDSMVPVVHIEKDPQGWLDFDISYTAGNVQITYETLYKAQKQGDEFIQVDPTTWVKVDNNTLIKTEKQLKEIDATPTDTGYRIPVYEFASLEEFIDAIGGQGVLDKAYKEFLDQLLGFSSDTNFILPEAVETYLKTQKLTLRPYQRGGIQWLNWLRQNHLHGILADDMGLGKTLQALITLRIGLLEDEENKNHTLIVAPKSVLIQWEREINRVFPFIRVYFYHGQKRNRNVLQSSLPYILLTTYETLTNDADILARIPFYYLILDEATRIKNPDSRRTQAIKSLNAKHRLALSGTPVENRPTELWSLFDFLMKGHLGKQNTFERIFAEKILTGNEQAIQKLGRRISPFLLRRKKEEVARDLPEKIAMTEWINLTSEQRDLYGTLQDEVKGIRNSLKEGKVVNYTSSILPILMKLKQICDHPALVSGNNQPLFGRSEKFDKIVEKIEEIVANGEKVVVFSHFLNMLSLFQVAMHEKGFHYIRIDGSTNNRQSLIDLFNQGNTSVALLSLMATGYGINLTSANHVIHADRWWNPAVEDQATDRVHRIGQNKTVYVYQFLNEGTLEEKIDRLLSRKRNMADKIIQAADHQDYHWSREELLELLAPLS